MMLLCVVQNALLLLLGGMEPGEGDTVQPATCSTTSNTTSITAAPRSSTVNADILDLLGESRHWLCFHSQFRL